MYNKMFMPSGEYYDLVRKVHKLDVSDVYVCVYNGEVGLFKKINKDCFLKFDWGQVGTEYIFDKESYISSCEMQDAKQFDDVRSMLYNKGIIDLSIPYEKGKASFQEVQEVVRCASSYYQTEKNNSPQRKRT